MRKPSLGVHQPTNRAKPTAVVRAPSPRQHGHGYRGPKSPSTVQQAAQAPHDGGNFHAPTKRLSRRQSRTVSAKSGVLARQHGCQGQRAQPLRDSILRRTKRLSAGPCCCPAQIPKPMLCRLPMQQSAPAPAKGELPPPCLCIVEISTATRATAPYCLAPASTRWQHRAAYARLQRQQLRLASSSFTSPLHTAVAQGTAPRHMRYHAQHSHT